MNNTFNFRRFGLLLRKTFHEKGLVLGGILVLSIALITFSYSSSSTLRQSAFAQSMGFTIGLFGVTIFVNILLNIFSKKSAAASYLSLPCSHFEKWLVVFVSTCLIFLPIFLILLKVIDTLFIDYYRELAVSKYHYSATQIETSLAYLAYTFEEKDNLSRMPFWFFLPAFFGLGGVAVVGSLYFNQKSYIKSALVFLGLAIVLVFSVSTLYGTVIGEKTAMMSFTKAFITTQKEKHYTVNASESIQQIVKYFIMVFIPVVLWLIGLVRFSDKEI